jgi:hypothetical protein
MRHRGPILVISMLVTSWLLFAITPQFWENFSQDELLKGTLTRVSLGPEGKLFLAPAYSQFFDTGQPFIFAMAQDKAGNLFLGTGHEGKVFKVDPQGTGSVYFQSKALDVFALAVDSAGILYVGTSPDGKVYKVTGPNQSTEFCSPEAKYIWALLFDEAGNLYVGTGAKGSILKVSRGGEKSTFYEPGDDNVVCLARESNGNFLAGTSPGGKLIEVNQQGKAFTLVDTSMEEIHAVAIDRFGTIYAAATSSKPGAKQSSAALAIPAGGAAPAASIQILTSLAERAKEGKTTVTVPGGEKDTSGARSAIIAISKNGGLETVYSSEDRLIYDLLVRNDDTLLAATGGKGRLLSVDGAKQITVITDSPEDQMTRMIAAGDAVFVAGSNQGRVYKLQAQLAQNGTFESRVMDAKVVSSWGKAFWRTPTSAGGNIKISTRSGNTSDPDTTWSDWSAPYTASGQQIPNPNARYMQWRAAFERGPNATAPDTLEGVQFSYLQQNLRPQVVTISILPAGVALQKNPSMLSGSMNLNLSAVSSDGESLNSPRQHGKDLNPMPPRQVLQAGAQAFTWKATDDNDDTLEYLIYFKGENESDWKQLAKDLTDAFYTLDGTALPDGIYRLKVVATDAPSNPYGKALIGELVSKPFVISNATPAITITSHSVTGKRVEILFHARVGVGHIASGEFSIDGREWNLVFPTDGIADSAEEDFQLTTPELAPGEHMIGLRASDGNGSTGTTKLVVRIQ